MEEIQERRQCTRTAFATRAQVLLENGQSVIEGELQDISIVGMFIETKARIALGSSCCIQITIAAQNSRLIQDRRKWFGDQVYLQYGMVRNF